MCAPVCARTQMFAAIREFSDEIWKFQAAYLLYTAEAAVVGFDRAQCLYANQAALRLLSLDWDDIDRLTLPGALSRRATLAPTSTQDWPDGTAVLTVGRRPVNLQSFDAWPLSWGEGDELTEMWHGNEVEVVKTSLAIEPESADVEHGLLALKIDLPP